MIVYLIRHGESEGDILQVHEGRADLPLTSRGEDQARRLARWLKDNESFDQIFSSTLIRAKRVAEIVVEENPCELTFDEDLMEWNNGLLAGVKKSESDELYPLPEGGKKPHHKFYETESQIEFRARAEKVVSILKASDYKKVCLISHGGMINQLLNSFLKLPMVSEMSFSTGDTGIHKLYVGESTHIYYLNKMDHLI